MSAWDRAQQQRAQIEARTDARMSALERRELNLEIYVEEVDREKDIAIKQVADETDIKIKQFANETNTVVQQGADKTNIAIERLTAATNATAERLTGHMKDMDASFKQLVQYHMETEQSLDERFTKIESTMATKDDIASVDNRLGTVESTITSLDHRLSTVESTMATKDDLTNTETRILDVLSQLMKMIKPQNPSTHKNA